MQAVLFLRNFENCIGISTVFLLNIVDVWGKSVIPSKKKRLYTLNTLNSKNDISNIIS